ncbi:DUF5916 domain-containing protein [Shewanella intestini]|uniref:carbohydrate binding family 9 domain-containing protein n=1 Tax=Shewanella TaxID=22 RepID=UPI0013F7A7D0|nr:carbohydrate binding family 9 domain-containing protein [Shewanella sp. XMDDZSB0408]MRG34468.1 hypothetical protein [Shewanella sp. XMDDZSB0408]
MKKLIYVLCLIFSVISSNTVAGHRDNFHVDIPTLSQSITVDGEFDEPQWQQAAQVSLAFETSPGENIAAPVTTMVKVFATQDQLLFAFTANDPEPHKIRANLRDRDNSWGDDLVGVKLDTYNNAKLAYQFFVNPFGVQSDSIENELTGQESDAWDGIWQSMGKMTPTGYQVEIALPLRLFNFNQSDMQTWGIELVRFYPRNETHRLSSSKIDRNNNCQLCQLGTATGLANAQQGQDLQITPSVVANRQQQRDLNPNTAWETDNNIEVGLDLRWGVTPTTLLNATINPDFSQVEADSGQLNINNNFALFFDEKRAFFLDNQDYFDTQMSLLHTRNIGSPDYGIKLTSQIDEHTVGFLAANDVQTQFLVPGNLSSAVATIDQESQNIASRYRYDLNKQFSVGTMVTLKRAENYHNYVASTDLKYQPTDNDTFTAQYAYSQTQYPDDLFEDFCGSDDCSTIPPSCDLQQCDFNERVLRTAKDGAFNDSVYRLTYNHDRRNWWVSSSYISIGEDFRGDLGFIEKVDFSKFVAGGGYNWYLNDNFFSQITLKGDWDISHNQAGDEIEQETEMSISFEGGWQSYIASGLVNRERVGRRINASTIAIAGNTRSFNETFGWFYGQFTPLDPLRLELELSYGDDIDFANNQLGSKTKIIPEVQWKLTESIALDLSHRYQSLNVDNGRLYTANLTDVRLNWQLSLRSFIRLSSVYTHIERDPSLYIYQHRQAKYQDLGNELLYGYKLNPQSVFYLGYSDAFVADDTIDTLTQHDKTYFMKLSYAWLL